jgi:hypothetical protein
VGLEEPPDNGGRLIYLSSSEAGLEDHDYALTPGGGLLFRAPGSMGNGLRFGEHRSSDMRTACARELWDRFVGEILFPNSKVV